MSNFGLFETIRILVVLIVYQYPLKKEGKMKKMKKMKRKVPIRVSVVHR
jgi:hypothetical protein